MRKAEDIAQIYSGLQKEICRIQEQADGKAAFEEDKCKKDNGSGLSCIIRNGAVIKMGGVNFSFVKGVVSPGMEHLLGEKAISYAATGISSILHPVNPPVPTIHINIRYFALDNDTEWFGGGIDLTPHYIDFA